MKALLEDKIKIMQAALAGSEVQIYDMGEWYPVTDPLWNWDDYDYRIKPEPVQVPFSISDYESKLGKKFRHTSQNFVGILIYVDANKIAIGVKEFSIQFPRLNLEWYNDLLNRWESCTKTVKR